MNQVVLYALLPTLKTTTGTIVQSGTALFRTVSPHQLPSGERVEHIARMTVSLARMSVTTSLNAVCEGN